MQIGIGDVGEVGAEQDAVAEVRQPGQRPAGEGGEPLAEVRERHGRVQPHLAVPLGEVQEVLVLGHAEVRDDQPQPGVAGQDAGDGLGPSVFAGRRSRTAVDHHRCPRLGEHAPRRVEQLVGRVVRPHLNMRLEDPRPRLDGLADVRLDARLGEEGGGVQAVGCPAGEVHRPVVQPPGHARLVRVEHGREGPYPELPEQPCAFVLLLPVGDRPCDAAGQRPERVEVGPDLAQHPLGHEMRVHVDQPGQPEPLPEPADPPGLVITHDATIAPGAPRGQGVRRDRPAPRPPRP